MNDSIFFKTGQQFRRVSFKDILFVEADRNYVNVYLKEEIIRYFITISKLAAYLPQDLFCRTHRSYLVMVSAIERFDTHHLWIAGRELPIGRRHRRDLVEKIVVAKPSGFKTDLLAELSLKPAKRKRPSTR